MHMLFFLFPGIPHPGWEVEGDLRSCTSDIVTNQFYLLLVHTPYAQIQRKPRKLVSLPLNFKGFSPTSFVPAGFPVGSTAGFVFSCQHIRNRLFSVGKDSIQQPGFQDIISLEVRQTSKNSLQNHAVIWPSGIWPTVVGVLLNQLCVCVCFFLIVKSRVWNVIFSSILDHQLKQLGMIKNNAIWSIFTIIHSLLLCLPKREENGQNFILAHRM